MLLGEIYRTLYNVDFLLPSIIIAFVSIFLIDLSNKIVGPVCITVARDFSCFLQMYKINVDFLLLPIIIAFVGCARLCQAS